MAWRSLFDGSIRPDDSTGPSATRCSDATRTTQATPRRGHLPVGG